MKKVGVKILKSFFDLSVAVQGFLFALITTSVIAGVYIVLSNIVTTTVLAFSN